MYVLFTKDYITDNGFKFEEYNIYVSEQRCGGDYKIYKDENICKYFILTPETVSEYCVFFGEEDKPKAEAFSSLMRHIKETESESTI